MSVFVVKNVALSSDLIGKRVKNGDLTGVVLGVKIKPSSTGFLVKVLGTTEENIKFWDFNDCKLL
jgi:hypothetical protein